MKKRLADPRRHTDDRRFQNAAHAVSHFGSFLHFRRHTLSRRFVKHGEIRAVYPVKLRRKRRILFGKGNVVYAVPGI